MVREGDSRLSRQGEWISAEARPLWLELITAVAQLEVERRSVPCRIDPEPFGHKRPEHRRDAAEACRHGCPVLGLCAAFADANNERDLVWGGADRTPPTTSEGRRRRLAAAAASAAEDPGEDPLKTTLSRTAGEASPRCASSNENPDPGGGSCL